MTLADQRLALGAAAVLSPTRAAELLPAREAVALAWLRARGLVREVRGLGEVVIWGDVVAAIMRGEGPEETAPPPRRATVRLSTRV